MTYYADTSALVKLVAPEAESAALRAWIAENALMLASAAIARTELLRAIRRAQVDEEALTRGRDLLARLLLIDATDDVLDRAGTLDPATVRSLDAIHLAAALALGDELDGIVTYDDRMADAARGLGIIVLAPR